MIDAGAVILGKTNVPVDLMAWQSDNPICGASNNPWDLRRSPGGSTGGGAAAAAAGLGFLTLYSDIGASIRVPAHFCGIYGHKPTLNIVPMHGHVTPGGGDGMAAPHDLAVAGPLARSAEGLAKAHSAGIVHRDLKPTNIMVNEDGVLKVLDFGLAKLTEQIQCDETASTATGNDEGRPITEESVIVGPVAYMSPEQAEGNRVDARSDIFSLGSVLYEMVTGQKVCQGTSRLSTLSAILHQEPKPISGITPAIPAYLEKLINRCLRKDPAKRFQHMEDLKIALAELKEESDSGKLVSGNSAPQRVGGVWRRRHESLDLVPGRRPTHEADHWPRPGQIAERGTQRSSHVPQFALALRTDCLQPRHRTDA